MTTRLLLLTVLLAWCGPLPAPAQNAPAVLTGRIDALGNTRVLHLWGTPRQRGYTEGYLLAGEILQLFDGYVLHEKLLKDPGKWNERILPMVQLAALIRPETRERAVGLADGVVARLGPAGARSMRLDRRLKPEDFLASLAMPDWLGFMCSSFVVYGELLESGEGPLVGRNLDYPATPTLMEQFLIKVEAPDGERHGWVSLGYPGFIGCLTGFSDKGVSVAIHDVPVPLHASDQFSPRADAFAQLIETLDPQQAGASARGPPAAAAALLRTHRFGFGGNLMLGWHCEETSGGAVLELDSNHETDEGVTIRGPEDQPFVVCSNHHRSRARPAKCTRYAALESGCLHAADADAELLDFERAWKLLQTASVDLTIYRCLADLETGALRIQHRLPNGNFAESIEVDIRKLCATSAAASKVSPVK